jgi:hypothetical protein
MHTIVENKRVLGKQINCYTNDSSNKHYSLIFPVLKTIDDCKMS